MGEDENMAACLLRAYEEKENPLPIHPASSLLCFCQQLLTASMLCQSQLVIDTNSQKCISFVCFSASASRLPGDSRSYTMVILFFFVSVGISSLTRPYDSR